MSGAAPLLFMAALFWVCVSRKLVFCGSVETCAIHVSKVVRSTQKLWVGPRCGVLRDICLWFRD